MKKTLLTIGIIAITALAGVFWYLQSEEDETKTVSVVNNAKDTVTQEAQKEVQNEKTSEVLTKKDGNDVIDVSNWKEYCDEEYGFCVRYPRKYIYRETRMNTLSLHFSEKKPVSANAKFALMILYSSKIPQVAEEMQNNPQALWEHLTNIGALEKETNGNLKKVKPRKYNLGDNKEVFEYTVRQFLYPDMEPDNIKTAVVKITENGKIMLMVDMGIFLSRDYNSDKDDPVYRAMIESLRLTN